MKTFRPAAASISLGCREFNLCVFVGAEILFFSVCFFSSFFYLLTCVVLPLSLSWSSLLVFASVCVWVFFFFLSSCFMMSSSQDVSAKTNAKTAWIRSTRYFPKTAAGSGACVFFCSFFSLVPMDPPQLDSDNFFLNFFAGVLTSPDNLQICWGNVREMSGESFVQPPKIYSPQSKSRGNPWEILGGSQQKEGKSRGESSENPRG